MALGCPGATSVPLSRCAERPHVHCRARGLGLSTGPRQSGDRHPAGWSVRGAALERDDSTADAAAGDDAKVSHRGSEPVDGWRRYRGGRRSVGRCRGARIHRPAGRSVAAVNAAQEDGARLAADAVFVAARQVAAEKVQHGSALGRHVGKSDAEPKSGEFWLNSVTPAPVTCSARPAVRTEPSHRRRFCNRERPIRRGKSQPCRARRPAVNRTVTARAFGE